MQIGKVIIKRRQAEDGHHMYVSDDVPGLILSDRAVDGVDLRADLEAIVPILLKENLGAGWTGEYEIVESV